MSTWTLVEALAQSHRLEGISEYPQTDIEWLLLHVLQTTRTAFFTDPNMRLTAEQQQQYEGALAQRLAGKPVAHIIGEWDFWTFTLEVNDSTLIPRPDTERLVERALELLPDGDFKVADLGTGTGAIALALASERRQWQLYASDYSKDAVALAERNRLRHSLKNVEVLQGSWLLPVTARGFGPGGDKLDLIVSNPPYIDPLDPHLTQGDLRFEPHSALVADDQGMADIDAIAEQARDYLKPGGWLLLEHGYNQGQQVRDRLARWGYEAIATQLDYGDNERITEGRLPLSV